MTTTIPILLKLGIPSWLSLLLSSPELHEKPGSNSQDLGYFSLEKKGKEVMKETAVCHSCYRKVATKHGNTSNYVLTHLRT